MNEKKFNKMAVSQIKNTAKSCYFLSKEKEKLEKEIAEKQARLEEVNAQYDEYQAPIKRMTGGYTTNELLDRQVVDTGKVDKDGRPIKVTNYVLKYPDTIIPPTQEAEPTDVPEEAVAAFEEPEIVEPADPAI
jgi:DNA-binding protein H-NS